LFPRLVVLEALQLSTPVIPGLVPIADAIALLAIDELLRPGRAPPLVAKRRSDFAFGRNELFASILAERRSRAPSRALLC